MPEVIPAIIPKSFDDLKEKMSKVLKLVPLVQLDVINESLAPLRAWPYQLPTRRDDFFNAIINEQQAFPFRREIGFEAHLMVREPEKIVADWLAAGAARIIVQIEGVLNFGEVIKEIAGRAPVGAALALDTPNDILKPIAEQITVIQCMGWEMAHLGRQGRPFNERTFNKVKQLRRQYPGHIICIDGGVNFDNAPKLLAAGADYFVMGSAIFAAADPQAAIKEANAMINRK